MAQAALQEGRPRGGARDERNSTREARGTGSTWGGGSDDTILRAGDPSRAGGGAGGGAGGVDSPYGQQSRGPGIDSDGEARARPSLRLQWSGPGPDPPGQPTPARPAAPATHGPAAEPIGGDGGAGGDAGGGLRSLLRHVTEQVLRAGRTIEGCCLVHTASCGT